MSHVYHSLNVNRLNKLFSLHIWPQWRTYLDAEADQRAWLSTFCTCYWRNRSGRPDQQFGRHCPAWQRYPAGARSNADQKLEKGHTSAREEMSEFFVLMFFVFMFCCCFVICNVLWNIVEVFLCFFKENI